MKNNVWDDGQEQLHDELLDFTIVGAYVQFWSRRSSARRIIIIALIQPTGASLQDKRLGLEGSPPADPVWPW